MSEIVKFVNHGAATITPALAEKVLRQLPQWKLEFTQIYEPLFPHLGGHLTFTKPYASKERFLRYQHENAYLLTKGNPALPAVRIPDVLAWNYSGNRLHPTQKPLGILTPIIESLVTMEARRCSSQPSVPWGRTGNTM